VVDLWHVFGSLSGELNSVLECQAMIDDRWFAVDENATHPGVKRDTIYKWIDRKNMPAHKVGRL
jgi:excisionase family DNA binding protein